MVNITLALGPPVIALAVSSLTLMPEGKCAGAPDDMPGGIHVERPAPCAGGTVPGIG
jgi:hypothetical protein